MANRFLGLKSTKKVKFMGEDLEIGKLTVAEVLLVQDMAKEVEINPNEENNMKVLSLVIQQGAKELADLTDVEMKTFPMDDLAKLSTEIMTHSGLAQKTSGQSVAK